MIREVEAARELLRTKWRNELTNLTKCYVIKYPRVWQSLFYLLGYSREDICEPGTAKLWWKKAHKLINDAFFDSIKSYMYEGPKQDEVTVYQRINWI